MSPRTITYSETLTVTSCWCGINLAIPQDLYNYARRTKDYSVSCPLGHKFIYNDTTEEQLEQAKRQLAQSRQREAATHDLLRAEERSHASTRGHLTRRNKQIERVHAGVCPHCRRNFQDLARHMASKHPHESHE